MVARFRATGARVKGFVAFQPVIPSWVTSSSSRSSGGDAVES